MSEETMTDEEFDQLVGDILAMIGLLLIFGVVSASIYYFGG